MLPIEVPVRGVSVGDGDWVLGVEEGGVVYYEDSSRRRKGRSVDKREGETNQGTQKTTEDTRLASHSGLESRGGAIEIISRAAVRWEYA